MEDLFYKDLLFVCKSYDHSNLTIWRYKPLV